MTHGLEGRCSIQLSYRGSGRGYWEIIRLSGHLNYIVNIIYQLQLALRHADARLSLLNFTSLSSIDHLASTSFYPSHRGSY